MADYKWKPIEDLPDDWRKLASSELAGLFAVWKEHVVTLKDSPAYLEFQTRLRREWAIETGIIEGLYDIDRGVTRTLIERGLHASLISHGDANKPAEVIIPMLKDHEAVVEGLFDFVGQQRQLSTSYIKQIHQALTHHQETTTARDSLWRLVEMPLLRGEWKRLPNNPTREDGSVHEYCPPEQTASEMDRLIEIHQRHLRQAVPPEVEAAWLHHRFTQIHPFQDGNGRVARTLASLVFLRSSQFPLVVHRDDRAWYIECLEQADEDNLSSLVKLFSSIQKKTFNKILDISEDVLSEADAIGQIIETATERLKVKKRVPPEKLAIVGRLEQISYDRLEKLTAELNNRLKQLSESYGASLEQKNVRPTTLIYNADVMKIAEELGYYADTQTYSTWIRLSITERGLTQIILSFHSLGRTFRGIWAISAFSIHLVDTNSEQLKDLAQFKESRLRLCTEPFEFADAEIEDNVVKRFSQWLDEVIRVGLYFWTESI